MSKQTPAKKRLWCLVLIGGGLGLLLWLFALRSSYHPEFGEIHTRRISTSDTQINQLRTAVCDFLGIPPMQGRCGPIAGLQVGPALLGWTSRSHDDGNFVGYFYMQDMPAGKGPLWEFALSNRKQLTEVTVTDLQCEFYGMDDPKGESVFGKPWMGHQWSGRTVVVPLGQIVFARLNTNRSAIYAIHVTEQSHTSQRDTVGIEYIVITNLLSRNPIQ